MESTERFSDRVENYVKYRPDYPADLVPMLIEKCGLVDGAVIADVGCGTGISSKHFLELGFSVIGVEPNENMRAAAVKYLAAFDRFTAVDGTGEATTLGDASVDMVVVAQAFHWLDQAAAATEFRRIMRSPGRVALIWNERVMDEPGFHVEYESLIKRHGSDYHKVREHRMNNAELEAFFGDEYGELNLRNSQRLDLDGLIGRTMSSSYMPNDGDPSAAAVRHELETLFAKRERNGRIEILYNTNVYFSCNFLCL